MKKILLWMSSTDSELINYCTKRSIMLQETLGAMVLFTGLMAFISGSYAIYTFTHSNVSALIGGAIYSFGIIQFDRFIVASSNKMAVLLRLPLAIIIGLAVSLPLETFILGERIDQELSEKHIREHIDPQDKEIEEKLRQFDQRISPQIERLEVVNDEIDRKRKQYTLEIQGTGGSGKRGVGPIAAQILTQIESYEAEKKELESAIESHKAKRKGEEEKLRSRADFLTVEQSYDLLARVEALEVIKGKSSAANRIAWLLRLLFVTIEIFPAVAKFFLDKNEYFALIEARNHLNRQQTNVVANAGMQEIKDNPSSFPGKNEPNESYIRKIKDSMMR